MNSSNLFAISVWRLSVIHFFFGQSFDPSCINCSMSDLYLSVLLLLPAGLLNHIGIDMSFHTGVHYFPCFWESYNSSVLDLQHWFFSFIYMTNFRECWVVSLVIGTFNIMCTRFLNMFWVNTQIILRKSVLDHISHILDVLSSSPGNAHISVTWNTSRDWGFIVRPSQS